MKTKKIQRLIKNIESLIQQNDGSPITLYDDLAIQLTELLEELSDLALNKDSFITFVSQLSQGQVYILLLAVAGGYSETNTFSRLVKTLEILNIPVEL